MLKLLDFLFTGCWHKWEHFKSFKIYDPSDKDKDKNPVRFHEVYKCPKCLRMKTEQY